MGGKYDIPQISIIISEAEFLAPVGRHALLKNHRMERSQVQNGMEPSAESGCDTGGGERGDFPPLRKISPP